ncbi:hypothetical protein O181_084365 [Austropuccinia psidii MF-1]|uniref:Reverse transcriptase Ty1/copia-type domain-containing protein n=1 Tax=Austropuccinia psidii MF-1 TaxID=1389203 RepID=A0A9Q3FQ24_9BASI|nr:hypothetical protein [Austropuccinia psidii MF-1]
MLTLSACHKNIMCNPHSICMFPERPGIKQWKDFLHVLRYLKSTTDVCITYQKYKEEDAIAYSDADWGSFRVTQRSVSGHLILLNKGLVIWKTKKQPTASLSSAKEDYKALCNLASEILWFQQSCMELNITHGLRPMKVHEDNQGCIDTANSDCNANTQRMKHIEKQLHFIWEAIKNSKMSLIYTPTSKMLADFLTKSVCKPAIQRAMQGLNLLRLGEKGDVKISKHFS